LSASRSTAPPDPLAAAGLAVNGWVPVDQTNLRTQFPQVYAIGDVCTGPRTVAKAGIFAESAALTVAQDIAASIAGAEQPDPYSGSGICYAEFGGGLVSKVEVNFLSGDAPAAERQDPSRAFAADKEEFGRTRRARWFGL
jgi:sulfide:quinone oxidoreductase